MAITFANIAVDLLADGISSAAWSPIRDGNYAHAPLPERSLGARQLDVETMYNVERFRPRYEAKLGSPAAAGAGGHRVTGRPAAPWRPIGAS